MRNVLVFLAKLAVSVGLIWFLLSRLSLDEITDGMYHPRWGWLVGALAVYAVSAFGGALQWSWLLKRAGIKAPGAEIRRLYFIGLFFNNFLPANIGGDAWKIVDLGRQEQRHLGVFCATLLDRIIGLMALTLVGSLVVAVASGVDIPLPRQSLLPPSPKLHRQVSKSPVERLLNVTVKGSVPVSGSPLKSATTGS